MPVLFCAWALIEKEGSPSCQQNGQWATAADAHARPEGLGVPHTVLGLCLHFIIHHALNPKP